jgi:hypothetical protein
MVNLRQDISSHLLQEVSTVSWDHGVLKISSEMSLSPPIVVHASLLQVVLAWCKRLLFYVHGWWTKLSIPSSLPRWMKIIMSGMQSSTPSFQTTIPAV